MGCGYNVRVAIYFSYTRGFEAEIGRFGAIVLLFLKLGIINYCRCGLLEQRVTPITEMGFYLHTAIFISRVVHERTLFKEKDP